MVSQVRKIFLSKDHDGRIIVEFTHNKRLRQQITDLNKIIEGQMLSVNAKQYSVPLTEKNLYNIKPSSFLGIFSKIKRKIPFSNVTSMTVSRFGS